jgi:hypothetical protein
VDKVALGLVVAVVVGVVAAIVLREIRRRAAWFAAARSALGGAFAAFARRPDTDLSESKGTLDGKEAIFAADATTTNARLEVPLREGVEKGRVYDLVVREEHGALETGTEDVVVGWDDEFSRLVFRARCDADPAVTVKRLLETARSFQAKLPEILDSHAKAKAERAASTFGALSGPNGRHKFLGLALTLRAEDWELTRAQVEVCEWERVPPETGEALPAEVRLFTASTDKALEQENARLALVERIALAFTERQPDGAFSGPAPEPHAKPAPSVGTFPAASVMTDHAREVVIREEETEPRPYRAIHHAVFLPWAVSVLEVLAPREEADALLGKVLEGASFEKPALSGAEGPPTPAA